MLDKIMGFVKGVRDVKNNVDKAGNVAGMAQDKNAAKEMAKGVIKSKAKTWFLTVVLPIFAQLLIVVVVVAVILSTVAYAQMMIRGIFDELSNSVLKLSTNVQEFLKDEIFNTKKDEEDSGGDDGSDSAYSKYLVKRFMRINKSLAKAEATGDKDKYNEAADEALDKKNAAVQWVYGKIYGSYFDMSFFGKIWSKIGWGADSRTYILRDVQYSAQNIYAPEKNTEIADARKENFGDAINVYDIEAFDYVAGTLFDLLDLDLALMRQDVKEQYKDELDASGKNAVLDAAIPYCNELLNEYAYHVRDVLYGSDGMSTVVDKSDLVSGFDNIKLMSKVLNKTDTSKLSSEVKWFKKKLNETLKTTTSYTEVAKKMVETESDYNKFVAVATQLDSVLNKYAEKVTNDKKDIKSLQSVIKRKSKKFVTKAKKIIKKSNKAVKESKNNAYNNLIAEKMEEILTEKVKELNLVRTKKAAERYSELLSATEPIAYIDYIAFDSSKISELNNLKKMYRPISIKYNKRWFKKGEYKLSVEYDESEPYWSPSKEREMSAIRSDFFIDANNNIIISGKDKSGSEYLTNDFGSYVDILLGICTDIENDWENIRTTYSFQGSKDSNIQILESMKEEVLEELKASASELQSCTAYSVFDSQFYALPGGVSKGDWADLISMINQGTPFSSVHASSVYGNKEQYKITQYWVDGYNTAVKDNPDSGYSELKYGSGIDTQYNTIIDSLSSLLARYREIEDGIKDVESGKDISNKDYVKKIIPLVNETVDENLKEVKNVVKKLEDIKAKWDSGNLEGLECFVAANITEVTRQNKTTKSNKEFLEGNSTLIVKKFCNTVEYSVKKVAEEFYQDVLDKIKLEYGTSSGTVMSIGDLELGANTVPTGSDYGSYQGAAKYLDITKRVCAENNIDPYIVTAIMAAESGGRTNVNNSSAVGIMQIEHVHWNKTVTLPSGESIFLNPNELAINPELSIKAGVWQINERMREFEGNLLVSLGGYNFGAWGVRRIILHHLESIGKASLSMWPSPNIYPTSVATVINEYIRSGDTGWLSSREWYVNGGHLFFGDAGPGTLNNIERVLSYYNTVDGMPWYYNPITNEKVVMFQDGATVSGSEDDSPYHKNKELVLWKEYYTENKKFEEADTWADEQRKNNKISETTKLSTLIIETIESISDKYKSEISSSALNAEEIKALVASTLNYECDFKIKGTTKKDVEEAVDKIAKEYFKYASELDGKEKNFIVLLYASSTKDKDKFDILNSDLSYKEYIKQTYFDGADSTTDVKPILKKVAKILSGDKDVDTGDFYKSFGDNSRVLESPTQAFYREWLEAKEIMHEMFNVMIDDGKGTYDNEKLPTNLSGGGSGTAGAVEESNIEGTLTIKNSEGAPSNLKTTITKNFIENNYDKNTTRQDSDIKYIVIHDTGLTNSKESAAYQYNRLNDASKGESMHYVVDSKEIVHYVRNNNVANHVGDSNGNTAVTNFNSIGVEIAVNSTTNKMKTIWNTVGIVKHLMKEYNIPVENVVLHKDVSGKECSKFMLEYTSDEKKKTYWDIFKDALKNNKFTVEFESAVSEGGLRIVELAKKHLGKPYVWGAKGPDTFDCSGLVQYTYKEYGITMTEGTYTQVHEGVEIPIGQEQPGDLVFFGSRQAPHHVGIYVGDGEFIHAPQTGDVVKITKLQYMPDYSMCRRILT